MYIMCGCKINIVEIVEWWGELCTKVNNNGIRKLTMERIRGKDIVLIYILVIVENG